MNKIFTFLVASLFFATNQNAQTCAPVASFAGAGHLRMEFPTEALADFYFNSANATETCQDPNNDCNNLVSVVIVGTNVQSMEDVSGTYTAFFDFGGGTNSDPRVRVNNVATAGTTSAGNDFEGTLTLNYTDVGGATQSLVCEYSSTGALPIELISFNAKSKNSSVMVNWQTASELNNDYMVVEHSMNGVDFEDVGRVVGAGTSNDLNNYELEHKNPETGFNYYRLRQVDFDGKMEYSEIVQVKLNSLDAPIRIYPTVVENELTIDLSNLDVEKNNIQVLNMNGQVLRNIENESNVNVLLQLSQFNNGMYLIRISGNGMTTQTHKFIKK